MSRSELDSMVNAIKIGIIGGSGFYSWDEFKHEKEEVYQTPYGEPSDALVSGKIDGIDVIFLSRHSHDKRFNPSEVNYKANIDALRQAGVTHILAATACESLQDDKKPEEFVILDSFIDRTTKRKQTFYDLSNPDDHSCAFIPMHPSFCERSRKIVYEVGSKMGLKVHPKGTIVTIEGPRFSSKAESLVFKSWNADVINMTTVPEVVLAKEAGISYVSVAMVTDYDCWRESEESVTAQAVIEVMVKNSANVKALSRNCISALAKEDWTDTIRMNKETVKNSIIR
uniref:S-methyl-5'-thioadenosine phosphorylase n=1 Tax=Caligus clemensi TaxID=344056 RepID=C1C2B0_CALCM|nr:S-methyl-5-thioadenosine phosphorylase [Caligus clemensi]